ncbi:hypothetical protein CLF_103543 [Clonorchis sinensis]|uniref:Uncharacterized protein n=1 Tax=Clonorchis sinensis TaxID=79923 RepID=G7YNI1_CLOSI|nr:hypothetical protein CLF_103543 [Clonorchis sinensis]
MCEWRAMRFFVLLGFLAIGKLNTCFNTFKGKSCSDLDLRTTAFTSKEAVLATRTVVIVEGEAKCRNKEVREVVSFRQHTVSELRFIYRTKWSTQPRCS